MWREQKIFVQSLQQLYMSDADVQNTFILKLINWNQFAQEVAKNRKKITSEFTKQEQKFVLLNNTFKQNKLHDL